MAKILGHWHKNRAARIARDLWNKGFRDRATFEAALRSDHRLVRIDPALVILMIKLALAIFDYFMTKGNVEATETDAELILAAIRYEG